MKTIDFLTKVDFEKEVNKQLKRNIKLARDARFNPDKSTINKIEKYCKKYNLDFDVVLNKYKNDVKFRLFFIKQPIRQSYHQKLQIELIRSWSDIVSDFKVIKSHDPLYVSNGDITKIKPTYNGDAKSLDLSFKCADKNFYTSLKHTNDAGGSQDNQYHDIRTFLRYCNKRRTGNNYFLAVVDGNYYTEKRIEQLREEFASERVFILSVNELYRFLVSFLPEHEKKKYVFID